MDEYPSVDKRLRSALLPFGYDVEKGVYRGANPTYFVFGYNTIPAQPSDDTPEFERYLIWVRIVAPVTVKITELVRQVKRALESADFAFPQETMVDNADQQEILLETEWAEQIGAEADV
ncbi:MAG: hypothetical protein K6F19_03910 [Oscillospiraceae bacterium]|nr:hypothetical protein [Oscillospiraceae bacterium]